MGFFGEVLLLVFWFLYKISMFYVLFWIISINYVSVLGCRVIIVKFFEIFKIFFLKIDVGCVLERV